MIAQFYVTEKKLCTFTQKIRWTSDLLTDVTVQMTVPRLTKGLVKLEVLLYKKGVACSVEVQHGAPPVAIITGLMKD